MPTVMRQPDDAKFSASCFPMPDAAPVINTDRMMTRKRKRASKGDDTRCSAMGMLMLLQLCMQSS